jgi:thiamine biosynthesis lipoprotein
MATVFEVFCSHPDAAYAGQAAQAGFALVDRLEQDMSRFIANSDVARINHLAAGESTRVSPSVMECLEIAWQLYDRTQGAFDVSKGTGLGRLTIVPDEFVVRAEAEGASVDLGGIGKGYAVDAVAELLEEWGVRSAVVHGGFSSVRALDAPPGGEGWLVTLSAPDSADPRVLARIAARQMALSASGTRKGDHILDPRTGLPVSGRAAWATVSLANADTLEPRKPGAMAEGLSTAFMILPLAEIGALCSAWPGVEAWIVEANVLTHLPA